jgi:protease II
VSSTSSSNDEYEKYRHLTSEVVKLIQTENERTRQSIDQSLKDEIIKEILQASASLAEAVPELGPTGQYLYLSDDCEGRRQYHRKHVESGKEQLVLDVSFHEFQIHSMSISVKETYLAYIISSVRAPSEMHVRILHLESGREMVLPTQGMTVSNIEWGALQDDGCDSLFFTTSNDLGRSCAIHVCCVRPNMEISPLRCIYKNDDETVMVDVQRTKGCMYVAIQASTKTSSEIYLIGNIMLAPTLVLPRQEGVLYNIDVGLNDDVFLLASAVEPVHESDLSEEMTLFETRVASLPLQSSFGVQYLRSDDGR